MNNWINKIHCGDALKVLKQMPDKFIDMVMTSPPYWGLREYGSQLQVWGGYERCEHIWGKSLKKSMSGGKGHLQDNNKGSWFNSQSNFCQRCGAWRGELGLEPTFDLYIKHLCDIFDEVKRTLKDTGTIWINLGDTYYTPSGSNFEHDLMAGDKAKKCGLDRANKLRGKGLIPEKCLCSIPQRFQIEMINRGLILRNVIIWYKSNCMPCNIKDRFTVDFEYIYFFSKQKKYYFEQQLEKLPESTLVRSKASFSSEKADKYAGLSSTNQQKWSQKVLDGDVQSRNKRCVWNINPKPFSDAHFAVYPEELCITPIKAGCKENGIVLDPFAGAGTTCLVAKKLGRNYIGIEINPEYVKMAERRIHNEAGLL